MVGQALGRRELVALCGGLAMSAGLGGRAGAQQREPMEAEPHHHLVFQNGVVRLWRVLLLAGRSTGWFVMTHDGVEVPLGGAGLAAEAEGGAAPAVPVKPGTAAMLPHQTARRLVNPGPDVGHTIVAELLAPDLWASARRIARPLRPTGSCSTGRVRAPGG